MRTKVEEILETQINKGNELVIKYRQVNSETMLDDVRKDETRWTDYCKTFIKKFFDLDIQEEFDRSCSWIAYVVRQRTLKEKIEEEISDLNGKINKLISIQERIDLLFMDAPEKKLDLDTAQEYDVAFSFAGQNRDYVSRVAEYLKSKGIRVFYDEFEKVTLWGKNLNKFFYKTYCESSKYCIPFISIYYKENIWTNHEFESAIERAMREKEEYILPVRFDDTEIEGLKKTTGYINIRDMSPEALGDFIIQKINHI